MSTSWIEMSGLMPGVTLRKILSRASSPNITEELDCSPLNSVEWASRSRSWPGSRWKTGRPRDRTAVGDPGRERPEQVLHGVAVVDGVVDERVTELGHVLHGHQRVGEPSCGSG